MCSSLWWLSYALSGKINNKQVLKARNNLEILFQALRTFKVPLLPCYCDIYYSIFPIVCSTADSVCNKYSGHTTSQVIPFFFKNRFVKLMARALGASLHVYWDNHLYLRVWGSEPLKGPFCFHSFLPQPESYPYILGRKCLCFRSSTTLDPLLACSSSLLSASVPSLLDNWWWSSSPHACQSSCWWDAWSSGGGKHH